MTGTPDLARSPSGMASPRLPRSRTQSISSDRPSTIGGYGLASPPVSVSPEAAFIAASAASQIVTNDHDSHADSWYDESGMIPAGETALVSFAALQLVNNFLDQLLFNFLQVSKATTLSALRPAVTEVLKPKLAKDAINNADEELREYLGGGDEDDYVQPHGADPGRDWDLELVWKRTRLRCMVYSSLGDMEEEDEDLYMEQENLEIGADEQISDVISPAVAIFLTSVLEYMGELTLTVAGQASYQRMRHTFEKELKEGTKTTSDIADRIVVEDGDMERVALDRTLGRLWRGWKKRIRVPAIMEIGGRPFSRASYGHHRNGSNLTDVLTSKTAASEAGDEVKATPDVAEEPTDGEDPQAKTMEDAAAKVPLEPEDVALPMDDEDDDIDEIEIPGLAYNSDDEDEDEEELPLRPKSFVWPTHPAQAAAEPAQQRPRRLRRERSASLPHARSRFTSSSAPVVEQAEVVSPMSDEIFEEALEQPNESTAATDDDESKYKASATMSGPLQDDAFAIGIARTTDAKAGDSGSEDVDDEVSYEKAEVMTSSRVSVASSSPSNSEGGLKKSNSVRSARMVDVKHGSRSPSLDAMERPHRRSASLSRASQSSSPSVYEGSRKPRAAENVPRAVAATASLRSSLDRVRGSETISESDEESDPKVLQKKPQESAYTVAAPVASQSPRSKARNPVDAQPPPRRTSSRHQQIPSNTKVTILQHKNTTGPFIDEPIPEVPIPASNRQSGGPDAGTGPTNRQRMRTTDSDDTTMLPLQSTASQRQTHTSGSSSSSATGRLKAVRTSEEHMPSHAESVARNFEELIQSNQTITYTLTPENMRNMDSPRSTDSPVMPRFPAGDRSRSSSTATEVKGAPSARMGAVGSQSPTERVNKPSPITIPGSGTISLSKSPGLKSPMKPIGSASPEATPKSPRVPASLARDARVPTDSTADFAEFIKSTGPPGDRVPPLRNGAAHASNPSKTSSENRRVSSTSNRNRYQPRDAAVDENSDNSNLIDFIRQGPPGPTSNPRIPRHVAPFRNTMDSEHMSGASAGLAVDASVPEVRNSQTSTTVTEPSIQSSANSNTHLLRNKPQQPAQRSNMFDEGDDMLPKRKQRRVRDPYAIDFSDEEEDEDFMAKPKPPVQKEESLADFLRNYDPPPEPVAPPVSQKMPKKKASAPSLMGRFNRAAFGRDKEPKETPAPPKPRAVPESRSLSSRVGTANSAASRGHVPIQVNMPSGYDKYGSVTSGQPRSTPSGPPGRKVPMKKFEPRDPTPGMSRTGTADLAAFLRDSEPPPSMSPAPPVKAGTGEESHGNGSLSKMFGRRKKPLL